MQGDANPYQMVPDSINWDGTNACPSTHLAIGGRLRSSAGHVRPVLDENHDTPVDETDVPDCAQLWSSSFLPLCPSNRLESREESDVHIPPSDLLRALEREAMNVNAEIVAVMHQQYRPGITPLSVSSPSVNRAFEGTRTLLSIINSTQAVATSVRGHDGLTEAVNSIDSAIVDIGGLSMMILACHQHLLSLFRFICCSIEQCLESMATEQDDLYVNSGSAQEGSVLPSAAQFTMVLQLLLHLVNRLDRAFLPNSSRRQSGASGSSVESVLTEQEAEAVPASVSVSVGVIGVAQMLLQAIPDGHASLQRTILQLQDQLEKLDAF